MDEARADIKPIADEFGKEKTAEACEVSVEIVAGKEPVARLKAHIRRMAFQILGPERPPVSAEPAPAPPPALPPQPEQAPAPKKKPRPERSMAPEAPTATARESPPSVRQSTSMDQYHAMKEKHPDMLLLFRNVAK